MTDMPRNKLLREMEITDKILDIFYHLADFKADFTTSDLQGAIQAQVHNAITYKDQ